MQYSPTEGNHRYHTHLYSNYLPLHHLPTSNHYQNYSSFLEFSRLPITEYPLTSFPDEAWHKISISSYEEQGRSLSRFSNAK